MMDDELREVEAATQAGAAKRSQEQSPTTRAGFVLRKKWPTLRPIIDPQNRTPG